jgi:MerR family mercuric resistance operon transcriptional regulator
MTIKPLTISNTAKQAGVGIETIRYYQRIGLITEPAKPPTGYRIYPAETVSRLLFIHRSKELGFSLSEIATLLTLGEEHCLETKNMASAKLDLIKNKIKDLQGMVNTLEQLVHSCEVNQTQPTCPIINAIHKR